MKYFLKNNCYNIMEKLFPPILNDLEFNAT